ncbi:NAD(P)/FAD-dependent oxidoreductase [Amphibacillus cookii]|uniref:NAD(P)/FAD-dependent oxidoreductase n=1 Tax=Amphibacillus cookii TaxID=767787 RepID=UPI00195EF909|nr:FAD-dependent oxidoreductase [Amphibacillus cookii]MBM7541001.1 glycine/D-amino acid oxidase-like deaminating enzyme [Amphibacillus cookii]
MNIQTGDFFWPTTLKDPPIYPTLQDHLTCDVLIIGGGSSGAQMAYQLADSQLTVALIEKNQIASGSTSANTALIQYAGERSFTTLAHTFGREMMKQHLNLCRNAINEIEETCSKLTIKPDFERKDSLYFTTKPEDLQDIEQEYQVLRAENCPVELLTETDISDRYPFKKAGALYYKNDAQLNPYLYTHGLIQSASQKGVQIFEQTEMNGHRHHNNGVTITTKNGFHIETKKVVYCCGYEGVELKNDKNISFVSTYTVTTKPVDPNLFWYNRTLIWETARPYTYLRTTSDHRVIIGGLDETTTYPNQRDAKLIHKRDQLIDKFNLLFPDISIEPDSYLTAHYGGTMDGLPIIGEYLSFPNSYFVFAFGDNGLVYSQVLTKIIADELINGVSEDLFIYRQDRPLLIKH